MKTAVFFVLKKQSLNFSPDAFVLIRAKYHSISTWTRTSSHSPPKKGNSDTGSNGDDAQANTLQSPLREQ